MFRGFESENEALAEAREDAETFGYSLADLCPCPTPAGAHLRKAHEAAVVVPGEYDSDDLDRIAAERDRPEAPARKAEWFKGDGIYVEGRVPRPWKTAILGPFGTYKAAHDAGRIRRLGGLRTFEVRDGRRVI